jgi:calcineurin-like phosphoesterase family protein
MRYVVSDTHFGHENIIEYCDRPFDTVEEMDTVLIEQWNETVEPTDTVLHLGDLAFWQSDGATSYSDALDGQLTVLRGNHDEFDADAMPFMTLESAVVHHGKYRFFCTHRPEDVPSEWTEWVLHGHMHNNDLVEYPFIDRRTNRLNCSIECLGYQPRSLAAVVDALERCRNAGTHVARTFSDVPDA